MNIYRYAELKDIAKKVKAELAREGIILEKGVRAKPRDIEKKDVIFKMAIDRIKRYPPMKVKKGFILPYFYK